MEFGTFTLRKLIQVVMSWSNINIKQLSQFIHLFGETKLEGLMENLLFRAKVVSIFREVPYEQVRKSDVEDVLRISNLYLDTLLSYRVELPTEQVLIDGKWYKCNLDRNKWTTGQIIDAKMLTSEDITESPEKLLAIFYLEKEYDGNNSEREILFAKKFPPKVFWNFINFFLLNYESRKLAILGLMTARAMMTSRQAMKEQAKNGSFGHRTLKRFQRFFLFRWIMSLKSRMSNFFFG